jgi:hypothetical protein
MSGEPVGSDEVTQPGKRLHDPTIFWTMGVLCRGFELGCVFHSEAGLHGNLLGPNQTEDAKAFIAGTKTLPTGDRLSFQNSGWGTSPVKGGDFDKVVRAYSFVAGNVAWTVCLGMTGEPNLQLQNGWHIIGVLAEKPGVRIYELSR